MVVGGSKGEMALRREARSQDWKLLRPQNFRGGTHRKNEPAGGVLSQR